MALHLLHVCCSAIHCEWHPNTVEHNKLHPYAYIIGGGVLHCIKKKKPFFFYLLWCIGSSLIMHGCINTMHVIAPQQGS